MTNLMKFNAADLDQLMDKIVRNSIGVDDYLTNVFQTQTQSNYPPYNVVQLNNTETRLEIALAGFTKDEVKAFTEYGKLTVKGDKEAITEEGQYLHKGLAYRNFERSWTLAEGTEVTDVNFENGLLTVLVKKIVPEHHARKDYI
tara:strand:+ start:163 stop:594 length:432 start_codon:yes stop_codon:yes gene_type:complete